LARGVRERESEKSREEKERRKKTEEERKKDPKEQKNPLVHSPLTMRSPSLTPPAMLHARILSSVDFPAPDGPMQAVSLAARHSPVTLRRIVFQPPPTAGT